MIVALPAPVVKRDLPSVDIMVSLLADPCQMRRHIQLVSSAADLMSAVVFHRQACVGIEPHSPFRSEGLAFQRGDFGEAVSVMVVAVAAAVLPVDEQAYVIVVPHYGGVDGSVIVECA